jgi:hypothetical protein
LASAHDDHRLARLDSLQISSEVPLYFLNTDLNHDAITPRQFIFNQPSVVSTYHSMLSGGG